MKKIFSLALAAAMLLTLLAGCGGSSGSNSGSSKSAAASAGSSSAAGSASASGSDASSASGSSSSSAGSGSSSNADASAASSGSSSSASSGDTIAASGEVPDFYVLSGPTGVGAAKLIHNNDETHVVGSCTVAAENDEVTAALVNGDADIACVATNVAANLFSKTDGGIEVLAVNTLGVLYILEKGDTVQSLADLAGKTVYAPSTARGANPEFILNHLLTQNNVDSSEVDLQWMTPQEITAKITSSDAGICMLPVPAATALMVQDSGVREAISLTEAWDEMNDNGLAMGCVVARTEYAEANPEVVEKFLSAYKASIEYMNDEANRADAAAMVADLGIAPNAKVAEAAIPQCSLTYLTGDEMKNTLEGYYQVLFQADPASIGGSMPYDSFYYGVG